MAVLLIGLPLGGTVAAGAKETAQAEGTALTYKTGNNISAQGENGFYYAWGTPAPSSRIARGCSRKSAHS